MKQMNTEKHESIQLTFWKMPKLTLKQRIARINKLCVKSYLEVLGYDCIVSKAGCAIFPDPLEEGKQLCVDRETNIAWYNDQKVGGVMEIARLLFEVSEKEILNDVMQYSIDKLMDKCGDRQGAIW